MWIVSRRQKTLAFRLRMFTERESNSVVGDKAGLSNYCHFFFVTEEGFIS